MRNALVALEDAGAPNELLSLDARKAELAGFFAEHPSIKQLCDFESFSLESFFAAFGVKLNSPKNETEDDRRQRILRFALFSDAKPVHPEPGVAASETLAELRALRNDLPSETNSLELSYSDLEKCAEKLLAGHGGHVRSSLGLKHILVDEYQDANDVQRRIIYRLLGCENPDAPAPEIPKDAPRLFAVGDPKQSIYRFRGAQVEVFAKTRDDIEQRWSGKRLFLGRNYRCEDERLLEFINYLFDDENGLFARRAGAAPASYENVYEPMEFVARAASVASKTPAVALKLFNDPKASINSKSSGGDGAEDGALGDDAAAGDEDNDSGEETSKTEADWIAAQIKDLTRSKADSGVPEFKFKDVVILRNSVKGARLIVKAFENSGIPYYIIGSSGLLQRQEVRDVVQWPALLARPDDALALAACAKQPCNGIGDAEMARIANASNNDFEVSDASSKTPAEQQAKAGFALRLRYLNLKGETALNQKLMAFRARLAKLERLAGRIPSAQLAETIVIECKMRETWSAWLRERSRRKMEAQACLANIDAFLSALQDTCGLSSDLAELRAFCDGIDEQGNADREAQLVSETDNVVRIMTIHQAKGLEFPVVFVSGLEAKGGGENESSCMKLFEGLWPVVKLPSVKEPLKLKDSADHIAIGARAVARLKEKAERRRLFYVAVTRASRKLFLSGILPSSTKELSMLHQDVGTASAMIAKRFGLEEGWKTEGKSFRIVKSPEAMDVSARETLRRLVTGGAPVEEGCPLNEEEQEAAPPEHPSPLSLKDIGARLELLSPSLAGMDAALGVSAGNAAIPACINPSAPLAIKPSGNGQKASELGTLFHRLMADWDFTQDSLDEVLDRVVCSGKAPSPAQDDAKTFLKDCAGNFLSMEWNGEKLAMLFRKALAEGRLLREHPFLHEPVPASDAKPAVLVNGTIDVILVNGFSWQIFDYKTGELPPSHYAPQMACYKAALESAAPVGATVANPTLLYVEKKPALLHHTNLLSNID